MAKVSLPKLPIVKIGLVVKSKSEPIRNVVKSKSEPIKTSLLLSTVYVITQKALDQNYDLCAHLF